MSVKEKSTRNTWFDAALELLEQGGVANVTINKLSKRVGVAKTSFYLHFESREDLLNAMLGYWVDVFTQVLTDNRDIIDGDPTAGMDKIARLVLEMDLVKYDVAIIGWAQHDDMVAKAVEKAHMERIVLLRKLFGDLGFEGEQAEIRAQLFVSYFSWRKFMMFGDKLDLQTQRRLAIQTLLAQ